MYSKIRITGKIELLTGLHIGGNSAFSAIGAVDNPIIRDVKTNLPIIPGSSFKGKMRTLLARKQGILIDEGKNKGKIKEHFTDDRNIQALLGGVKNSGKLIFSDMILSNAEALREMNIDNLTEVKFENSIPRSGGSAKPRQIERAIRGSQFDLDLIYEVNNPNNPDVPKNFIDDIKLIKEGLILLQYDYLGGSGSRGYGKIKISNVKAEVVVGDKIDPMKMNQVNQILGQVEQK